MPFIVTILIKYYLTENYIIIGTYKYLDIFTCIRLRVVLHIIYFNLCSKLPDLVS